MGGPQWNIWPEKGGPDWRLPHVNGYNANFPPGSAGLGQRQNDPSQTNDGPTNDGHRRGIPQDGNSQHLDANPDVEHSTMRRDPSALPEEAPLDKRLIGLTILVILLVPPLLLVLLLRPQRTQLPPLILQPLLLHLRIAPVSSQAQDYGQLLSRLRHDARTEPALFETPPPDTPRPSAPRPIAPRPDTQPVPGQAQGYEQLLSRLRHDARTQPGLFETPAPDTPSWMGFPQGKTTRPQRGAQNTPQVEAEPQSTAAPATHGPQPMGHRLLGSNPTNAPSNRQPRPQGFMRPGPQGVSNAPSGFATPQSGMHPTAVTGGRGGTLAPQPGLPPAPGVRHVPYTPGSFSSRPNANPSRTMGQPRGMRPMGQHGGMLAPPPGLQNVPNAPGGSSSFPSGVNPAAATMAQRGSLAPPPGFQPPPPGFQNNPGMLHALGSNPAGGLRAPTFRPPPTLAEGGSAAHQSIPAPAHGSRGGASQPVLRLVPPSQYVPPSSARAGQPSHGRILPRPPQPGQPQMGPTPTRHGTERQAAGAPGTSSPGGPTNKARPKRVVDKPWNELGMSKSRWSATHTKWGRLGLTKEQYLEKEGISAYHFNKLERGEQMRAQQAREAAEAAQAAAASGATASQGPGTGTKRTQSEADEGQEDEEIEEDEEEYHEDYDDDDDDDDDNGSRGRGGAPSPDSDDSYIP
ncbi:hypothetical protein LA080_002731 [Diaporthe eres]|nr:hypothetical protein LA080_002731 [Diaporthe eres]